MQRPSVIYTIPTRNIDDVVVLQEVLVQGFRPPEEARCLLVPENRPGSPDPTIRGVYTVNSVNPAAPDDVEDGWEHELGLDHHLSPKQPKWSEIWARNFDEGHPTLSSMPSMGDRIEHPGTIDIIWDALGW